MSGLNLTDATSLIQSVSASFWTQFKGDWLIVTLGEQGSLVFSRSAMAGLPISAPALQIQAVDTVGAGDAFCRRFVCGPWGRKTSMTQTLVQANTCGAMVASKLGVLDALPSRAALDAFLSR